MNCAAESAACGTAKGSLRSQADHRETPENAMGGRRSACDNDSYEQSVEGHMADKGSKREKAERVNINEPYELADWTTKWGVSADKIREAVRKVGPLAKDVLKELRKMS